MKILLITCLLAVFSALPCLSELVKHKNHDVSVSNMKSIDVTASTAVLTQPGIQIIQFQSLTLLLIILLSLYKIK